MSKASSENLCRYFLDHFVCDFKIYVSIVSMATNAGNLNKI
jgi:hypothetical protein